MFKFIVSLMLSTSPSSSLCSVNLSFSALLYFTLLYSFQNPTLSLNLLFSTPLPQTNFAISSPSPTLLNSPPPTLLPSTCNLLTLFRNQPTLLVSFPMPSLNSLFNLFRTQHFCLFSFPFPLLELPPPPSTSGLFSEPFPQTIFTMTLLPLPLLC